MGSKTLFNAVFIRPEQVVHFLLSTYLVNIYFVNCYNCIKCMCSVFTSACFGSRDDNIANAKATITICHNQHLKCFVPNYVNFVNNLVVMQSGEKVAHNIIANTIVKTIHSMWRLEHLRGRLGDTTNLEITRLVPWSFCKPLTTYLIRNIKPHIHNNPCVKSLVTGSAVTRASIGGGVRGVYSYTRVLPDEFLLTTVMTSDFKINLSV